MSHISLNGLVQISTVLFSFKFLASVHKRENPSHYIIFSIFAQVIGEDAEKFSTKPSHEMYMLNLNTAGESFLKFL